MLRLEDHPFHDEIGSPLASGIDYFLDAIDGQEILSIRQLGELASASLDRINSIFP
jgi:hypothetical protein